MARVEVTREKLEELYLNQHLTMAEIGAIYGRTRQRICQLVKLHQLNTRTAERFTVPCPACDTQFETTRRQYRKAALRYCSSSCYQAHRRAISTYNPSRQGQRIARAIMEAHLGRPLQGKECVHHVDGDNTNNNLDNLMLFISHAEHLRFHHLMRTKK